MSATEHSTSEQPAPGRRAPEARRTAILTAASDLICERGTAALTHRAIAARAGVAVGSTTKYFSSINEIRDEALRCLADETDKEILQITEMISTVDLTALSRSSELLAIVKSCAERLHEFLSDSRQVNANLAMMNTATTDSSIRNIELRWSDQITELLTAHVGQDRAIAIVAYIDGVTVHAALHDTPVGTHALAATLTALLAMPDTTTVEAGNTATPEDGNESP